jgi:ribosomal protein S27E
MDINNYNVSTCVRFIGSVPSKDDIIYFTCNERPISVGDVVYVTDTDETYLCIEGAKIDNPLPKWELISTGSDTYDNANSEYTNLELVETKCSSCGAPLKILSKYDSETRCEYCGSVYRKHYS